MATEKEGLKDREHIMKHYIEINLGNGSRLRIKATSTKEMLKVMKPVAGAKTQAENTSLAKKT